MMSWSLSSTDRANEETGCDVNARSGLPTQHLWTSPVFQDPGTVIVSGEAVESDGLPAGSVEQGEARRRHDEPDWRADPGGRGMGALRLDQDVAKPRGGDCVLAKWLVGIELDPSRAGCAGGRHRHQIRPDAE